MDSGLILYRLAFILIIFLSFNPYFSGFRSYTWKKIYLSRPDDEVSILISVDSGLIRYYGEFEHAYNGLCFNPYFSGFRSYTEADHQEHL